MSGEEHDGHFGAPRALTEIEQRATHVVIGGVGHQSRGKSEPAQGGGDVGGIVWRIRKPRHVAIGAVADDERDLVLCARRGRKTEDQRNRHGRRGDELRAKGNGEPHDQEASHCCGR